MDKMTQELAEEQFQRSIGRLYRLVDYPTHTFHPYFWEFHKYKNEPTRDLLINKTPIPLGSLVIPLETAFVDRHPDPIRIFWVNSRKVIGTESFNDNPFRYLEKL